MKTVDSLIERFLIELVSRDSAYLYPLLKGKGSVSEFKLADKLKITVNQTRNILYGLEAKSLVSFTRKKDQEKGWYIYYWMLDMQRIKELILSHKRKKLNEYQDQLINERENKSFVCPNKCSRMNTQHALESNFCCPECESVLVEQDGSIITQRIEKEMKSLKDDIDFVRLHEKEFIVKKKKEEKKVVKKRKVVKKAVKKKKKVKKSGKKGKKKVVRRVYKKKIIKSPIKLVKKLFKIQKK